MLSNVIVAAALVSAPVAYALGNAKVINACEYEVTLCNVPSADGGYSEIDKTLSPNDTYSQTWTQLSNGNGWSIKLSKSASLENILQYEYTFHNDGIIWYDLSEVNGNPWDGNWEITAEGGGCTPKQTAYRYATDDAYGMQACSDEAEITVTLCSGESQNDGAAAASSSVASQQTQTATAGSSQAAPSSYASSQAAPTSSQVAPVAPSVAPASSAPVASAPASSVAAPSSVETGFWHSWNHKNVATPTATTLVTSAATSVDNAGATVTNVQTVVETAYATATVYAREAHHHRRHQHPHARR